MPELRKDPITARWVIIATDRAKRPSDFNRQTVEIKGLRFCPFCPGNELRTPPEILAFRTHGGANEPGWTTRVIASKFPVLRVEGAANSRAEGLYDKMNGIGAHEVIIESPEHFDTLSTMPVKRVEDLFWAFRERVLDLRRDVRLRSILLFKNFGEAAGGTLEHTHSQLIALPIVPRIINEETEGSRKYYDYRDRCVYCDISAVESETGTRIVLETDHFTALCPYAPRFPFETWIIPKLHNSHAETMTHEQIPDLANVIQRVFRKINSALEYPPYNLVLHTAPLQDPALPWYHWHIEIIPKMTRVAGFEWSTGFYSNPTPPEESAKFLREANG